MAPACLVPSLLAGAFAEDAPSPLSAGRLSGTDASDVSDEDDAPSGWEASPELSPGTGSLFGDSNKAARVATMELLMMDSLNC